ncbi:MAG: transposase [Candidatus Kaiserbacteria bacterium]|nr:MAG: transposase [Candidatus Kaiserbacteria bacterium]
MLRKRPLEVGEIYHIFNRGAHKQRLFTAEADFSRFSALLHMVNNSKPVVLRELLGSKKHRGQVSGIFSEPVDKALVEVLAYSLMPNHFHLVVKQKVDHGISNFMKKLGGGYSMYFNTKYGHSGVMYQGPFKSSHIDSDPYFKWIFAYVHLNPLSISDPDWQEKGIADIEKSKGHLRDYAYSSYHDYYVAERPERAILAYEEAADLLDKEQDLHGMIEEYSGGRALFGVEKPRKKSEPVVESV